MRTTIHLVEFEDIGAANDSARKSRLKIVPVPLCIGLIVSDIAALLLACVAGVWLTAVIQAAMGLASYMPGEILLVRAEIYLPLCVGVLIGMWSRGVYSMRLPWWSQVKTIVQIMLVAFLVDGFIHFAVKNDPSRLLIAASWTLACLFVLALRYMLYHIASRMDSMQIPAVIMADNEMTTDLITAFHHEPCTGYNVHTVFLHDENWRDFDRTALPVQKRDILLLAGISDAAHYVLSNPDNFYVISSEAFRGQTYEQLIQALEQVQAQYALVPSLAFSGFHGTVPHYYFGHDVMMMPADIAGHRKISPGRIAKRVLDIVIASLALFVLSPLFLVVALMLKIEGQGGSVFYSGKRVGRGGRLFKCWKFRSMEPNSDHLLTTYLEVNPVMKARWEKYRKLPHDPRITTRTAKFIRAFSIDELPQLWNVLTGDMSLVGPRPILEEEQHYFGNKLHHYLSVRPGLTGLWQVSGRNHASFARRVYWDSWYVRNWSLWHDIIILLKTPFAMLSGRGAY